MGRTPLPNFLGGTPPGTAVHRLVIIIVLFDDYFQLHRNERHRIRSRSLEAVKRADRRLTCVPIIFLILRACGMLRFCIYISSTMEELQSETTRNIQEVLVYVQVRLPRFDDTTT